MSDETFHGKLSKLGFRLSREQLGKLVEEATKQRLTAVRVLEQVAEAEVHLRLPGRVPCGCISACHFVSKPICFCMVAKSSPPRQSSSSRSSG